MKGPEESIKGAKIIYWSPLDERHFVNGNCHVTVGDNAESPYAGIAIGQRPNDPMAYLFFCDSEWKPLTDTYHSNIDRAKEEAEMEFGGVGKTWNEVA